MKSCRILTRQASFQQRYHLATGFSLFQRGLVSEETADEVSLLDVQIILVDFSDLNSVFAKAL
jgi:hypothetical protein